MLHTEKKFGIFLREIQNITKLRSSNHQPFKVWGNHNRPYHLLLTIQKSSPTVLCFNPDTGVSEVDFSVSARYACKASLTQQGRHSLTVKLLA